MKIRSPNLYNLNIAAVPWQVFHTLTLFIIGTTAMGYNFAGTPFPRPTFLYVGTGMAFATLFVKIVYSDGIPWIHQWVTLAEIIFIGFFLRASIYVRIAAGGVDTRRWANFFEVILNTNSIPDGAMYYESPIFLLHLTIGRLIGPSEYIVPFGLEIYDSSGISIAIASLTPLFVFWVGNIVTDQTRVALASAVWAGPFFLFLRSSTLMQSEFLAVPWFILTLGSLLVVTRTRDRRWSTIFIYMGTTSVLLHYFYSAIITTVCLGTICCYIGIEFFKKKRVGILTPLVVATLPAVLFMIYYILTSGGGGGRAVQILGGITSPEVPQNIFSIFVPTEGAAAESTGTSGKRTESATSPNIWRSVLIFSPAVIAALFASLGGLYALIAQKRFDQLFISSTILMVVGTLILLLLSLNLRLHFRLYYFVGVFIIIYAGYSLSLLSELEDWRKIAKFLFIVLFCIYSITSPMSPLGNNADSPIRESGWAVTESEWKEKVELGLVDDKSWQRSTCEYQNQVVDGIKKYCTPVKRVST